MKKTIRFFKIFSIFALILLFALASCGGGNSNNSNSNNLSADVMSSGRTIKVVKIEGEAEVVDENGATKCFKGMNLYDGDKLNVKADSVLVIKFDEDKYVYLGENTTISVKSQGKDKYKTNVFVETGKVLAEIQRQLDEDEEFFLSSNNSVMAVRGTVFGISVKKVAQEIVQKYSVYRGVTELYLFDVAKDGGLISGKISDIQNSEYEIKIPESELLDDNSDYNKSVDDWLTDVDNDFDDSEGANDELEEVQITVGTPSMEDYQEIIETVGTGGGSNVTYSNINYKATGYYGEYDGLPHSLTIDVETEGAKIYYKTSEDGEYSETNPTFTEPGYYRTYYKITCDGYDDKEDYGVVQISKGNLDIEYKENLVIPNLIQGMSLENALSGVDLKDYIGVKGAARDNDNLAKTTFNVSGNLGNGTNTYVVEISLDDNIKNYYNPITAEISLTAYELVLDSTDCIYQGVASVYNINDFNKYNGVKALELFNDPNFTVGGNAIGYNNVTFNYDYLTEGYYELLNGLNTVGVTLEFDDYSITTDVSFYFQDSRYSSNYDVYVDEVTVSTLAEGSYYFNTNDINVQNNNYVMTTSYLAEHLGIGDFSGYINLPTDVLDSDSDNYLVSNSNYLEFPVNSTSEIELLLFPTYDTRGSRKIISIYFSETPPSNFPTYTIKNSLSYYPGYNFDFVISDSPVAYSLDGVNYQSEVSINSLGEHEVYFRVGDSVVTKGSRTVLITTGGIESDVLDMISSQMSMLSTDGINTIYKYYEPNSDYPVEVPVASEDGTTISPMNDIYEIYTNLIKNATYYNDLTHEEIEVEVTITPNVMPNFSYEVMADGYASLRGSVNFNYILEDLSSDKNNQIIYEPITLNYQLSVANPTDLTVSLSDVDRVYASRIVTTIEDNGGEYELLYSYDEGKTWVDESPVFTEVGQYKVYSIYKGSYSYYEEHIFDMTVVSIQNITITE